MFTRYDYKAGSTAVNVVADIVKLLTGTTDKATLSANCVQASTVIINDGVTRPAGWTEWDAAAGTNARAVRALNYDGASYKYAVIYHNGTTGLFLQCYENWNAVTHVGTNLAYGSSTEPILVNLALGGTLMFSASARSIVGVGVISGTYDANGPQILIEHSRDEPWDTVAYGLPPYGSILASSLQQNFTQFYKVRNKNITNMGDSTFSSTGIVLIGSFLGGYNLTITSPQSKVRDANLNLVHAFSPIIAGNGSMISGKLFDIFLTTSGYGAAGDEVMYNSNTYFIMASNNLRLAIPKF